MNSAKRDEPPPTPSDAAWRRRFVSALFHELGQPLTALHCSLELALRKTSTREELRDCLQQALEISERLLKLTARERQIADADDPGTPALVDLTAILKEVAEEMQPVAESLGKELVVAAANAPVFIRADRERIKRALFSVADLSLGRLARQRCLLLALVPSGPDVLCYFGENASPVPAATNAHSLRAFEIGTASRIVSRMIAAAGGSLQELFFVNYCACILSFPVCQSAEDLSDQAAKNFSS